MGRMYSNLFFVIRNRKHSFALKYIFEEHLYETVLLIIMSIQSTELDYQHRHVRFPL